jgi:hypothetical protein
MDERFILAAHLTVLGSSEKMRNGWGTRYIIQGPVPYFLQPGSYLLITHSAMNSSLMNSID